MVDPTNSQNCNRPLLCIKHIFPILPSSHTHTHTHTHSHTHTHTLTHTHTHTHTLGGAGPAAHRELGATLWAEQCVREAGESGALLPAGGAGEHAPGWRTERDGERQSEVVWRKDEASGTRKLGVSHAYTCTYMYIHTCTCIHTSTFTYNTLSRMSMALVDSVFTGDACT